MSRPSKALSTLGLCARAKGLVSGEEMTEQAVKSGKAELLFLALDASANTTKKFRNLAESYEIPLIEIRDRETLGGAIGKEFRASAAVIDPNFASLLLAAFSKEDTSSLEEEHGSTNQDS